MKSGSASLTALCLPFNIVLTIWLTLFTNSEITCKIGLFEFAWFFLHFPISSRHSYMKNRTKKTIDIEVSFVILTPITYSLFYLLEGLTDKNTCLIFMALSGKFVLFCFSALHWLDLMPFVGKERQILYSDATQVKHFGRLRNFWRVTQFWLTFSTLPPFLLS